MRLMKRRTIFDPFDHSLIPSEEETQQFDPHIHEPCCTATSFRPDLRGPPKTKWNRSAARVFVESFLTTDSSCKDEKVIEDRFFTHLKYLQNVYRKRQLPEDEKRSKRKLTNRTERKRQVCLFFLCIVIARLSQLYSCFRDVSETPLIPETYKRMLAFFDFWDQMA